MKHLSSRAFAAIIVLSVMSGACLAEFAPFSFPKDEVVVFENHQASGKIAKVTNTYSKTGKNFVIKATEENGDTTKIVVDKN